MKLTILGNGSGMPEKGKNHSSMLLEGREGNYLLDCGEPVARTLAGKGFGADYLDGIVLTHFHPDHSSGIYMVIQYLHISKREKALEIYVPENEELFSQTLDLYYLFKEKLNFKLLIRNIVELPRNHTEFKICETDHLKSYAAYIVKRGLLNKMKSYSILVIGAGKNLLYTSDFTRIEKLQNVLSQAGAVLLDGLHPQLESLLPLLNSDKQIYITHGMSKSLSDWINSGDRKNIQITEENQAIQF